MIRAEELLLGMAQDLQEYVDAAWLAGCDPRATEGLLREVDEYFRC